MDHKVKLKSLLDEALDVETLEAAFYGFMKKTDADDENVKKSFVDAFKPFWATVPNNDKSRDEILSEFVAYIHQQKSLRRIEFCFEFLSSLVSNNVIPARLVCEAVLKSKHLKFSDEVIWCKSFQLIHKIVGGTDYKGCGGVLSLVFTKFNGIPKEPNPAYSDRIQSAVKVIQYIFDRKACLLPAYFVISEIYNHFPEVQGTQAVPHWSISKLLSSYVDSFRPLAHIVTVTGRSSLLPIIGHPGSSLSMWKLDPITRSFPVIGSLPYDRDLLEPQDKLLQYVIGQPYSREIVCTLLGLHKQHKQRCPALEQLLVDLIVIAMEKTENNPPNLGDSGCQLLWHHLSSHLIFFVLFQFASFPHMVTSLYDKLSGRTLKKGRNHLMWVLLQFISGSIQKNPLSDFKPVLRLFELLYPESEPLPEPDINSPNAVHSLAMASIWIHLTKKAELEKLTIKSPTSHILKKQLEFIHEWSTNKSSPYTMNNYAIPILCNAYSTIPARFTVAMTVLVEMCFGNGKVTTSLPGPSNTLASGPTIPCPMSLLDSLTVHAKMSFIHSIFSRIMKLGTSSATLALAPALVETYSRLLVYMEIESLGIKGIISHLLPTVFKNHAWGILHTLLEMFSYRLHHVQPVHRVTLLSHLHSIASVPHTNQNQLQLCVESTALRLITGLGSSEVQTQLTRFSAEPKQILSSESEELNRALVLTIARSMHVTGAESCGNWCEFILRYLVSSTPHSWASHTLACFPQPLQEFYNQNTCPVETKQALKTRVEDEYRRWKGMTSENDILSHFAEPSSSNVFICILWKLLLETGRLSSACHKVLERLGARTLSSHIRVFADFLVYEFSTSGGGRHVNKCIQHLNDLIWKYNVVTMDRLVLSLALRSHEGNEAQVCFFIIQLLLLKPPDFRTRVNAFVRENSPHHWTQTDWHQKHMAYHTSFPERFYYEGLLEAAGGTVPTIQYLPIYFGNVCLRFLPVFDIVIHRFLELPPVFKSLESLLDHLGSLYKFHARPVTYLYNTLHYYEQSLHEKPTLKKKLVSAIIGAQRDIKPTGWCLSKGYLEYLYRNEDAAWTPELSYYCYLIGRVVDTIAGTSPSPFPECDWRFNEFPNATAHALYVTALEIMSLPISPKQVGKQLFDVIYKGSPSHQQASFNIRGNIMSWINAVAHVMTSLPDSYWSVIYEKICEVLKTDLASRDVSVYPMMLEEASRPSPFPYSFFDFKVNIAMHSETHADYVLALTHAVWYHASIGQLTFMPHFIRTRVTPLVNNEAQLLYICCLVGPFLQRFKDERTRCLQEIVVELYHLLEKVDREAQHLHHIETICGFLYHIKYMFVGDLVRDEVQKVIPKLRQSLQVRLRFMLQTIKTSEEVRSEKGTK